jgi:hypothetical protein
VRPERPHQAEAGVFRTPEEQVADFVRDRAAQQDRHAGRRAGGDRANRKQIHGHQHAAALLAIDQRLASADTRATSAVRCMVDEPSHQIACVLRGSVQGAPSVLLGTRQSTHCTTMPALLKICSASAHAAELVARHARVVVGPDGHCGVGLDAAASGVAIAISRT